MQALDFEEECVHVSVKAVETQLWDVLRQFSLGFVSLTHCRWSVSTWPLAQPVDAGMALMDELLKNDKQNTSQNITGIREIKKIKVWCPQAIHKNNKEANAFSHPKMTLKMQSLT